MQLNRYHILLSMDVALVIVDIQVVNHTGEGSKSLMMDLYIVVFVKFSFQLSFKVRTGWRDGRVARRMYR